MSKRKQGSRTWGTLSIVLAAMAAGAAVCLAAFLILAKVVENQGLTLQAAILPATLAAALGAAAAGFVLAKLNGREGLLCGTVASAGFSLVYLIGIFLGGMPQISLYTPLKLFAFTAAGCFGGHLGTLRIGGLKHRRMG